MENSQPKAGTADASFRASETIEGRSALILAKVALQVIADLHPEAPSAIDHALTHQIEAARTDKDTSSLTLAAILEDVRARLRSEDDLVAGATDAWMMDKA